MSRTPSAPDVEFDAAKISPSRVNSYLTCGEAFRRYYLEKEPKLRSGSAALFGSVLHTAMEGWTPNRQADLLTLVRSAWLSETEGTVVKDFLAEYQSLSVAAIKQEHEVREAWKAQGKESKAPRMTSQFKSSPIGKKLAALMPAWEKRLNDGSPWGFDEYDPLPALYDESLVLARRIQARLGHLPPSLHTEFACDIEWRGFRLTGYIDVIEPVIHPQTGELVAIGVLDYKTYKKLPMASLESDGEGEGAELKDYRQLVIYDVVVRELVSRGVLPLPAPIDNLAMAAVQSGAVGSVPLYVGVDYLRCGERRWWSMGAADHDNLEAELKQYRAGVEAEVFLPAPKGTNPKFCDYGPTCCLRQAKPGCAERVEVPA